MWYVIRTEDGDIARLTKDDQEIKKASWLSRIPTGVQEQYDTLVALYRKGELWSVHSDANAAMIELKHHDDDTMVVKLI